MKKFRWKASSLFSREMSNKKVLKHLSGMIYGLSAIATTKYPDVARKLEKAGDNLSLNAETASKKANIQSVIGCIIDDLIFSRDLIIENSAVMTVDTAISELTADINVMYKFLEENIATPLFNDVVDRRVTKFMSKKESVKAICRMAEKSLTSAQNKREGLSSDVESVVTQRRVAMRMQQLDSTIATQTDAAVALSSIVDKLDLLTDYAKMSPALAKKINRKIKLKTLGDIFYQPVKSKAERDRLNSELYFIIANIKKSLSEEVTWSDTLYGQQSEDLSKQATEEVETDKIKIQKPQTNATQSIKNIKNHSEVKYDL